MSINRKRGSIDLARSLCYQINGAADDSDDSDGGEYGSVDIAEILSAEVERLQEALAQQEQEPVAWRVKVETKLRNGLVDVGYQVRSEKLSKHDEPLYTHPPQRTWVGLTDEEIADCAEKMEATDPTDSFWREFFKDIVEAKLKEKNT